jgi:hypothetical protein
MAYYQNYNSLVKHCKDALGAPVNSIELTDDEIADKIRDSVLPEFSQYVPFNSYVKIAQNDKVDNPDTINTETYIIPNENEDHINSISEAYYASQGINSSIISYYADPRDTVMANTYSDMISSLQEVQNYEFIQPDKVMFGTPLDGNAVILKLNIIPQRLDQVPSDLYIKLLKPMAEKSILEVILNRRTKFQNLSTPFGEVALDVDTLRMRIDVLKQEINEKLDWLPTKHLIEFL